MVGPKCGCLHCKDCARRGQLGPLLHVRRDGSGRRIQARVDAVCGALCDWAAELDTLGYDPACVQAIVGVWLLAHMGSRSPGAATVAGLVGVPPYCLPPPPFHFPMETHLVAEPLTSDHHNTTTTPRSLHVFPASVCARTCVCVCVSVCR